jgi:hypothetical protein
LVEEKERRELEKFKEENPEAKYGEVFQTRPVGTL